jgi:hypothetical protein
MCFALNGLKRVPFGAHGLAEDLEFGWHLRLAGERVFFAPEAKVFGKMVVSSKKAAQIQRARWEEGRRYLKNKMTRLIHSSPNLKFLQKLCFSIEVKFPTLVTLATSTLVLSLILGFSFLFEAIGKEFFSYYLSVLIFLLSILVLYCFVPTIKLKLPFRYLLSIRYVLLYVIWKGSVVLGHKPTKWLRTPRE